MKKIVIIGSENVGKSTLFNKLCQKDLSIVNNYSGLTRDYIKGIGKLYNSEFKLMDTAGWHFSNNSAINLKIRINILLIIQESDLIFFVIDAKTPLLIENIFLIKVIKRFQKKTILLVNKSEIKDTVTDKNIFKLGIGGGVFIGAEHNLGLEYIYYAMQSNNSGLVNLLKKKNDALSLVIVGRPNVGKSTLFNSILGFERSLVSNISGTTRDYLSYETSINNQIINLIDTAGIRRKNRVIKKIEELSVYKAIDIIKISDIILLVMDPNKLLQKQDLALANLTLRYGKLLVPLVNKRDLINQVDLYQYNMRYMLEKRLSQIKNIPSLLLSAKKNFNKKFFFNKIINLWNLYNTVISTSKLNNWLRSILSLYSMPIVGNTRLKIKYIKQNSSCPPTFAFFSNLSKNINVNKNFKNFLVNSLRKKFLLHGIPIKVYFIFHNNPFAPITVL